MLRHGKTNIGDSLFDVGLYGLQRPDRHDKRERASALRHRTGKRSDCHHASAFRLQHCRLCCH